MKYRLYDFEKKEGLIYSDDLVDIVRYFNTENHDYRNCLIQVLDGDKYVSVGVK